MMFIKTKPEIIYPYDLNNLRRDCPDTSFPQSYEFSNMDDFDVFRVKQTPKPAYDKNTKGLDESAEFVGNEWVQVWTVRAATPEELAQVASEQVAADDNLAKALAKADATIKFLVSKTPAEIEAKINADVTNIATAKVILSKLAIAVGVFARNSLRGN